MFLNKFAAGPGARRSIRTAYTLCAVGMGVLWLNSTVQAQTGATPISDTTDKTIYVSTTGNDTTGTGSSAAPFATISRAVGSTATVANSARLFNTQNFSVKILVSPGTYRNQVDLPHDTSQTSKAMLFEANGGTVDVKGSDVWNSGWTLLSGNIWWKTWSNDWGAWPSPSGWPDPSHVVRRREMVFGNGARLTQQVLPATDPDDPGVASGVGTSPHYIASASSLTAGQFCVDEAANRLYVCPPTGVTISGGNVTAGTLEVALRSGFWMNNRNNVKISGINFSQCTRADWTGSAVTFDQSDNCILENSDITDNTQTGVSFFHSTTNITVSNVTMSNNAANGFGCNTMTNALFQDVAASGNNWRGAWGNWLGWDRAGIKTFNVNGALFQNVTLENNQSKGLWLDSNNENYTIDKALIRGNNGDGCWFEYNGGTVPGDIILQNSVLTLNAGAGLSINNSDNVDLERNIFYANGDSSSDAQIVLGGSSSDSGGRTGANGVIKWKADMIGNLIVAKSAAGGQPMLFENLTVPAAGWSTFLTDSTIDKNLWYNMSGTMTLFDILGNGVAAPTLDFTTWKSTTGKDAQGVSDDPHWASPDAATPNFNRSPNTGTGTGWLGNYYDDESFSALKLARIDPTINFDWGTGSPAKNIAESTFSVRWMGQVKPKHSGLYTFFSDLEDGGILSIKKSTDSTYTELTHNWTQAGEASGSMVLQRGTLYDVKLDFRELTDIGGVNEAHAIVSWQLQRQPETNYNSTGVADSVKEVVPKLQVTPAAGTLSALILTSDGGADTHMRGHDQRQKNYGANPDLLVQNAYSVGSSTNTMAYLRFDTSPVTLGNVTAATLSLKLSAAAPATAYTFNVYGLEDGFAGGSTGIHDVLSGSDYGVALKQPENWPEGTGTESSPVLVNDSSLSATNWLNAPANASATLTASPYHINIGADAASLGVADLLGSFTVPASVAAGTTYTVSGTNVANFLDANTDNRVTFIIVRAGSPNATDLHKFYSKEGGNAPLLNITYTP